MDEFQKLRILLATILTAGFNADRKGGFKNDGDAVDRGLSQADNLLDKCGQVDPNTV